KHHLELNHPDINAIYRHPRGKTFKGNLFHSNWFALTGQHSWRGITAAQRHVPPQTVVSG
ncbi:hypothetical protein ACKLKE_19910, partial [Klebsiella quasipneumoniae subsp. similipneumoniae]|uniref:hypothetical protein n=1 Tax=Klebsiella quasipneumoniae TaxID=1463165 RepID=UPI003B2820F2